MKTYMWEKAFPSPRYEETKRGAVGLRGDLRVCSGRSAAGFGRKEGASGWRSSGEHPSHICILFSSSLCNNVFDFHYLSLFLTQFITFCSADSPSTSNHFFLTLTLSLISNHLWCRVCRGLPDHMEVIRGQARGTTEAPQTRECPCWTTACRYCANVWNRSGLRRWIPKWGRGIRGF